MELKKNHKRGLFALIVLGVVALLGGPGIMAYFSDTETSTENLFTAGTIDLAVNGENPWTTGLSANLADLKPCMKRWGNVTLTNVGTNPFDVWLNVSTVSTADGLTSEPETAEEAGTAVNNIDTVIRYDLNVGGVSKIADAANYFISAPQHGLTGLPMKEQYIYLGNIPAGGSLTVDQSFVMDCATTNWAQGDTMTFYVNFYALQSEGDSKPPAPTPELAGFTRP